LQTCVMLHPYHIFHTASNMTDLDHSQPQMNGELSEISWHFVIECSPFPT
jgi:hypothetical protein